VNESGRNRQATWYFLKVDGLRGQPLTVHLTDLVGEYNFKPGACAMNADTFPVFSQDGEHWQHVPAMEWDDSRKEATVHLPAASNSVWIAHATPYPLTRLQRLLDESAHSPYVRLEVIGHSLEGRELQLVTVTDSAVSALNKKCIWLITRQHA